MVVSSTRPAPVSRTSSSSSIDFTANAFNAAEQRRTRKRITAAQLAHLEQLYRQSSHPTRDEREALAKRIQMETKSVTIWFQNKRQTDRKVALHNATNSRNVDLSESGSGSPPNITLTTPTSPTYPPGVPMLEGAGRKSSSDGVARRQSLMRPNTLRRTSSLSSPTTSTSTITTNTKTRPSLDRVASRSEIRFIERAPFTRSSRNATIVRASSSTTFGRTTSSVTITRTSSSAPIPRTTSLARTNGTGTLPPPSPPPSSSAPLWATMLSSPLGPSSPPPTEYVAYTRTRKARTLDWACASARLTGERGTSEFALVSGGGRSPKFGLSAAGFEHNGLMPSHLLTSTLGPASPPSCDDAADRAREYEEATSMTEDEAELVTPHGSQDAHMPWTEDRKAGVHFSMANDTQFTQNIKPVTHSRIMHVGDTMDVPSAMDEIDTTDPMPVDGNGWEEDEMHAALALCGLRG